MHQARVRLERESRHVAKRHARRTAVKFAGPQSHWGKVMRPESQEGDFGRGGEFGGLFAIMCNSLSKTLPVPRLAAVVPRLPEAPLRTQSPTHENNLSIFPQHEGHK